MGLRTGWMNTRTARVSVTRFAQTHSGRGRLTRLWRATMRSPPRRLGLAVAVALAVHALLLFGIGFSSARAPRLVSLEVTLVHTPATKPPAHVQRFAAHNQLAAPARPRQPLAPPSPAHPATQMAAAPRPALGASPSPAELAMTRPAVAARAPTPPPTPAQLAARKRLIAGYLARWRQRVEQAGSRHFPSQALAHARRHQLTIAVVVNAQGRLLSSHIVRSSGSPRLDRAALHILHLAGPFPPFPARVKRHLSKLGFAYTWRFLPTAHNLAPRRR